MKDYLDELLDYYDIERTDKEGIWVQTDEGSIVPFIFDNKKEDNMKEKKENSYIFRLSSNIKQINNISYDIQGKLLDKLLKICEIADRRLIEFTIHKGNINQEIGVEIKFSQKMELKGIKDVEYVDIGENYVYAWVSTLRKYQLLNL